MDATVIRDASELVALCKNLAQCPWVGVDTEFVRERTYYSQLCLIQVASADTVACIDPLALEDLTPLMDLLYDPSIIKVMHAARQDLELFYDRQGELPTALFDTQVAATFVGYGDQVGYGPLVKALCDVELAKAHTRTNWCRRPLSSAQVQYAEDDVRYLGELYMQLRAALDGAGRRGWFEEEMAALTARALYQNNPAEAYRRLKRGRDLPADAQQVLRALAAWREQRAQTDNRPRSWVLSDAALVELAAKSPQTVAELNAALSEQAAVSAPLASELLEAIRGGTSAAPVALWERSVRLSGEQKALCGKLMDHVRRRADELDLAPSILATRTDVESLVRGGTSAGCLRGWRRSVIGDELRNMIQADSPAPAQQGA